MDGFDLDGHLAALDRDGYTIIADFLSSDDLAEVRRVLSFYLGSRSGRNNFEGYQTERVYTLVARNTRPPEAIGQLLDRLRRSLPAIPGRPRTEPGEPGD